MKRETKSIVFEKLNGDKLRVLKKQIISIEKQPLLTGKSSDNVLFLTTGRFYIIKNPEIWQGEIQNV